MKNKPVIHRREFLNHAALAFLSGVVVTLASCGKREDEEESTTARTTTTQTAQGKTGIVSTNHGHSAVITAAQMTSGQAMVLTIQGTATHAHTVNLSANDMAGIRQGVRISRNSTIQTDGHGHVVTFN